jgi:hypothetical protein
MLAGNGHFKGRPFWLAERQPPPDFALQAMVPSRLLRSGMAFRGPPTLLFIDAKAGRRFQQRTFRVGSVMFCNGVTSESLKI